MSISDVTVTYVFGSRFYINVGVLRNDTTKCSYHFHVRPALVNRMLMLMRWRLEDAATDEVTTKGLEEVANDPLVFVCRVVRRINAVQGRQYNLVRSSDGFMVVDDVGQAYPRALSIIGACMHKFNISRWALEESCRVHGFGIQ